MANGPSTSNLFRSSVSTIEKGGGGGTYKRHFDAQVRSQFRATNDVKGIF